MRRLLKFLHTLGAVGLIGAAGCMLVAGRVAPPPASLAGYAAARDSMTAIATWVFLPSLALTLMAGLVAMAMTNAYLNAGWAWVKLATGVLIFEGFIRIQGSMGEEARRSAEALAGRSDPAAVPPSPVAEQLTLALVIVVAVANVALGIWRPRLAGKAKSRP